MERLHASGVTSPRKIATIVHRHESTVRDVLRARGVALRTVTVTTEAEKDLIVALHHDGLGGVEIARRTGRSLHTVRDVLRARGLVVKRARPRVTDDEVREMVRLYTDEQMPIYRIGERLGRVEKTVKEKLVAAGVTLRPIATPEEEAAEMERLYVEEGLSHKQVGLRTGHHEGVVRAVLTRRGVTARTNKLTSYERVKIRKLYREGLTAIAVAEQTGHTVGTVLRVLNAAGIDTSTGRPVLMPERAEMVRLYESGVSLPKVAERLGRPEATVLGHLRDAGVKIRGPRRPSRATRDEMERLYVEEQRSLSEVSEATGWSYTTVQRTLVERGIMRRRPNRTLRPAPNRVPHAEMERTIAAYREEGTIVAAARRLGLKESTVTYRLKASGEPIDRHPKVRRPNHTAPEREREVIRLYIEEEWTQTEVCAHVGMSPSTFTRVLERNGVPKLSRSEAMKRQYRRGLRAQQVPSG